MPRPAPWLTVLLLAGCSAPEPVPVLRLEAAQYGAAFDAAVAVARAGDMPPALRDRRGGLIETEPSFAASIFEPWRGGNASVGQALENTLAFQQRRARFEFTPAGAPPPPDAPGPAPDVLGTGGARPDLSRHEGPIELRVSVIVERRYVPGIRRDTWTRANTTRTTITRPATDAVPQPKAFWTPVTRDAAAEQRLLAAIRDRIGSAAR